MPRSRSLRKGLTRAEVIVLIVLSVIWVAYLLMPRHESHEIRSRITCAANLNGLGKGLYAYASDGNQGMPISLHAPATQPGIGRVRYAPGMIGRGRDPHPPGTMPTGLPSTEMSVTRELWTMIRLGGSTPGSFVCPASQDVKNDEDNPQDYWDFASYNEISYGYQVPYGLHGKPTADGDQRAVLAADKGPFGATLEAGRPHPGVPGPGPNGSSDDWRLWNSPNHGGAGDGEGQYVLFADSHAEWAGKPTAGVKNDNIYTRWSDPTGGTDADPTPRIHGTSPTGIETPFGDTDSLVYP